MGEGDRQRQKNVYKNRKTLASSLCVSVGIFSLFLDSAVVGSRTSTLKKFGAREKKGILYIFSPVRTE